jgi:hypothetical protein
VPAPDDALRDDEYREHRLGGVLAKYNRSVQLFDELRGEIGDYLNGEPGTDFSKGEFDTDTWEWLERYAARHPPIRWGVLLGDCVHNLRSALDHLICQVALLDGGTLEDCAKSQFPIASKSEEQFERMADRYLPKCFSEKHRAMVKEPQPFHAGGKAAETHPLSVLADFSNADKHRMINLANGFMDTDPAEVLDRMTPDESDGPSPIHSLWMAKQGTVLVDGTPWFRIVFDRDVLTEPPARVDLAGNIQVGVAFGEIGLDSRSFKRIGEYVYVVIERFMREFPETRYHD